MLYLFLTITQQIKIFLLKLMIEDAGCQLLAFTLSLSQVVPLSVVMNFSSSATQSYKLGQCSFKIANYIGAPILRYI